MVQFTAQTAENGEQFITAFIQGQLLSASSSSHSNFNEIQNWMMEVLAGESLDIDDEKEIINLFDIGAAAQAQFEKLTDLITVDNGQVLYKGEPTQPGLSAQIVRFMSEDLEFMPLVYFMEKIQKNPSRRSREQAWEWLNNHDFTIMADGNVVIYKGVYPTDDAEVYRSGHTGTAYRNGVKETGYIHQTFGDRISMPREDVMDDPNEACSYGLHVGTYGYAKGYGSVVARVIIDPMNIVSVPADGAGQKIRVCEYFFDALVEQEDESALYSPLDEDEVMDEDEFALFDEFEDEDHENGIDEFEDAAAPQPDKTVDKNELRAKRIAELERSEGIVGYSPFCNCISCDSVSKQLKSEGL